MFGLPSSPVSSDQSYISPTVLGPRSTNATTPSPIFKHKFFTSAGPRMPISPPSSPPLLQDQNTPVFSANTQPERPALDERFRRRSPINPLLRSSEQRATKRRDQYLAQVQERRAEKSWNAKGERILQRDYMSWKRRWEAELSAAAPDLEPEDVDWSGLGAGSAQTEHCGRTLDGHETVTGEEANVDDVLAAEARELDALIELHDTTMSGLNEPARQDSGEAHDTESMFWGSDDEDFEAMLLTAAQSQDTMDTS